MWSWLISLFNPVSAVVFVWFWYYGTRILPRIEKREGVHLDDPILSRFKPQNWTTTNIIMLNTSVACIMVESMMNGTFRDVLNTHALTMLVRAISLYLVPLEAPRTIIPLRDPIVEIFLGRPVRPLEKDLFPSGHTLFVWVNLFWTKEPVIHSIYAISVPLMLILQHVHYTIDVFMAPFVAFGCTALVQALSGGT